VIAGLAVFVARHAAFAGGKPDWLVIQLAVLMFVAVWRFVVPVVVLCAAGRPRGRCHQRRVKPDGEERGFSRQA
jgi:hypothetical protein